MQEFVLPNYGRYNVWPVRGEGPYIWDRDGKKYLDFAGGVAVCPLGHCPPTMVKALTEQANTLNGWLNRALQDARNLATTRGAAR